MYFFFLFFIEIHIWAYSIQLVWINGWAYNFFKQKFFNYFEIYEFWQAFFANAKHKVKLSNEKPVVGTEKKESMFPVNFFPSKSDLVE